MTGDSKRPAIISSNHMLLTGSACLTRACMLWQHVYHIYTLVVQIYLDHKSIVVGFDGDDRFAVCLYSVLSFGGLEKLCATFYRFVLIYTFLEVI